MIALVEKSPPAAALLNRKATAKPKTWTAKAFTLDSQPQHKNFTLRMSFRKGSVKRDEVITALEGSQTFRSQKPTHSK